MKTLEERVTILEKTLKNLQDSFIQAQKNLSPTTAKVDDTANKVEQITPYTDTKTAYIGDTEVVFNGVKDGNLTVYVKDEQGNYPNYTVERTQDIITVYFEPLEYITTITISIQ